MENQFHKHSTSIKDRLWYGCGMVVERLWKGFEKNKDKTWQVIKTLSGLTYSF